MNDVKSMPAFSLTKSAAERIAQLLQIETGPYFRIQVNGGGCSGFQYGFDFDESSQEDDAVIENNGVKMVVDSMSYQYLVGSTVDYQEGLQGAQFLVKNPNATTTCGCGSSFTI